MDRYCSRDRRRPAQIRGRYRHRPHRAAHGKLMKLPKLTRLELRIMETLWTKGASSIRELLEAFPESERLAYTTVQTVVFRL